jgi:antiphage defense system Thoeris ThsB-like protein
MADPRAFLSFDFDYNETEKKLFAGQANTNSPTPFTIQDWSSKSALPQYQWEALIATKISKCNLMIVLVGKNMSSATGVAKEIQFAKDANVPVFGIYVGGASSTSNLPVGLPRNRTISWTWSGIASAIDQMMTEKKNS